MPWYIWLAFGLTVGLAALFALLFGVLSLVLRKTGGYAPGWQLRCTDCGHTRDAAEAGIVRIGSASHRKQILGRCTACGKLRMLALQREPQIESDCAGPSPQTPADG